MDEMNRYAFKEGATLPPGMSAFRPGCSDGGVLPPPVVHRSGVPKAPLLLRASSRVPG